MTVTRARSQQIDRLLHGRQPNAGARIFVVAVQPLKDVEDLLLVLGGDADAIVADLDDNLIAGVLIGDLHLRGQLGLAIGDGVLQQVGEDLAQQGGVAFDDWQFVGNRDDAVQLVEITLHVVGNFSKNVAE